jgi:mannonate dehydratase
MKNNRRGFIKKSASLVAAASLGSMSSSIANAPASTKSNSIFTLTKDAGMQASEAYFSGMDERKIALSKQMEVFGAVGGINPKMVGFENAKAYEEKSVLAVKDA